MKNIFHLLLLILLSSQFSFASENPPSDTTTQKNYTTQRLNVPPIIDGLFDDACWGELPWSAGFITRAPKEGQTPLNKTAFKMTYDEKFIYLAIRCHDSDPDKIVRRLTRRDAFDGDWVEVNIDSYNDKRSAFSFTINAAGVIGDEFITNNGGNWDSNWNPIWYVKTNIDELGWTAEMKIPLSQLRFPNKEKHTWGLQFTRYDFRNQERSNWKFISQNTAGWVSNFGVLDGIEGILPQKQLEIQPYLLAKMERYEKEEGNPFSTGKDQKITVGLDAKIGVTSDLTLDLTVNPDFGQVEADPSVLNLDGYQVFFSERRPFFIENRNIFNFQVSSAEAGGSFTSDNVFYSRRIGSSPSGNPEIFDGEYVEMPQNASILGAAKFSGKTQSGTSIGILESVTQQEVALISDGTNERTAVVEPLTNFFVGRVQQDFKEGNSYVGGIFTAVNRKLEEDSYLNEFMHKSAYTSAVDFMHRWDNQSWYVSGTGLFSTVSGTAEAITNTQTDFVHNKQRTDAEHLSVDESKTSLGGHGGSLRLGKIGGNYKFESGFTWRSPDLELNDVGFLRQTDYLAHYLWAGYRDVEQGKYLNNWRVNYNHWFFWDFSGRSTHQAFNVNAHAQLKNFWGGGTGSFRQSYDVDTRALRGGPGLRSPKGINHWFYVYSDNRKKLNVNVNGWQFWGEKQSSYSKGISVGLSWQPMKTMRVSLSPDYSVNNRQLQYVTNESYDNGTTEENRYINGSIHQQTLGLSIRLNYTVRPNMTIQFYGQPFITRGEYDEFKYITNPMADDFNDRFANYDDDQITFNQEDFVYLIDENKDGTTDYTIDNPNFDFIQFRSNLVYRWEYIPGSTVFVVWSQGTTYYEGLEKPMEQPIIPDLVDNVFNNKSNNIFLVKLTYRFIN